MYFNLQCKKNVEELGKVHGRATRVLWAMRDLR